MIRLIDLTKWYERLIAVDSLNLEVEAGEIFGFLGPNGAGKTTTVKMMAGLLKPNKGSILLAGHDLEKEPVAAKSLFGYIPDRPFLYEKLTAREYLRFTAALHGIDGQRASGRTEELLSLFELKEWGDELIEGFSHGMRQRLVISGALIHRPRIIIVDEPMVGLDPKGVRLVKGIFRELAAQGASIFMCTHSLEIAEEMCHRVAILQGGKILAQGTLAELRRISGSEGERLEEIFLKLTGAEDLQVAIEALRA
ncbi:MAG: ABC transporter ATP-binding protein [candidate division NC10 bacterium]|nr:ABC transporter ATP-binding protein [candidate division NC10 bacterium]